MSNMTARADNSLPPPERRVRVRQPVSALAYLDIGADNGGIILNVSDEGMALQAVGPLDQQKEIGLRIQLPHSEKRIETTARIIWLRESNRQAGVRFSTLSADARAQIQRWIRSHGAEGASGEAPTDEQNVLGGPLPRGGSSLDSQREKWLSLMEDFATQSSAQRACGVSDPSMPSASAPPTPPVLHPRPKIVSRHFGERAGREASPVSTSDAPVERGTYAPKPPMGTARARPAEDSVVDTSMAVSRSLAVPSTISQSALLRAGSGTPTVAGVDAGESARNVARRTVAAAGRLRARNQIVAVALFALFSILCFGIGTWVGNFANRHSSVRAKTQPTAAATIAANNATLPAADSASKLGDALLSAHNDKKHSERGSVRPIPENARHKPGQSVHPANSAVAELQARRNTVTEPLGENSSALNAIGSLQKSSPIEPAPVAFVPEPSNARVIDGRVLRPSDRFNPCHLTYRVEPTYPLEAREQGVQGTVRIHLVIAADGSIQSQKAISGPPLLVSAALDATKYWRYFPALLNGEPVETEKDVDVPFLLSR
jgi:TonB family protein